MVRSPKYSTFVQGGVFNSYPPPPPPPVTGEYAKWFIQDGVFNSYPPHDREQAKWYAPLSILLSSRAGSLIVTPPPPPPPVTGEYAKWFIQDEVFNSYPPHDREQAKWYAPLSILLSSRAVSLIVTTPPPVTGEYAKWFIQDEVFNSYPPMTENKRSGTLP